ncbi:neuronal pentraxin-1-like [Sinocyclocheilus rhinocerous]|uniref:neuronal pentraxin-1-like n=1 Tax=Sinocyclocheilus rhinocerous TaxID=307959 RepID=UPI0007B7F9B8|nr:PREDICTED: neuronal pentraxin-1-like [Sinocyclocheilus rhinocerous]
MEAGARGMHWKLLILSCLLADGMSQDFGQTQFICTSVPKDMDICAATLQNSVPGEDLKSTVMQLRETVLQQKETIMNQKETIRELTSKLTRCESQSASEPGRRKEMGTKNTMGDVSRGPTDTLAQLSRTLQSLKQRLENLEVAKLPFLINDGKWHHICITWTTRDGVWEAYQDGVMRGNGDSLAPYHPIKPQGVLILGQEQDTLGGGFDATQAFVGDMANFNIWDRKLSVGEIYNLATCSSKAQVGNVFSWLETSIEVYGGASKWTFEACRQLN